jgi:hypothetical protein
MNLPDGKTLRWQCLHIVPENTGKHAETGLCPCYKEKLNFNGNDCSRSFIHESEHWKHPHNVTVINGFFYDNPFFKSHHFHN